MALLEARLDCFLVLLTCPKSSSCIWSTSHLCPSCCTTWQICFQLIICLNSNNCFVVLLMNLWSQKSFFSAGRHKGGHTMWKTFYLRNTGRKVEIHPQWDTWPFCETHVYPVSFSVYSPASFHPRTSQLSPSYDNYYLIAHASSGTYETGQAHNAPAAS